MKNACKLFLYLLFFFKTDLEYQFILLETLRYTLLKTKTGKEYGKNLKAFSIKFEMMRMQVLYFVFHYDFGNKKITNEES